MIAELDGNNAVVRSYLWGLDLAGQKGGGFADAGGIGGLVAVRSGAEAHFYMQDGLGNVSLTYDAVRQTESSRYEFGPFGEILRASGTWTANNPFRYSSKYWDAESDLLYFGYRHYNPTAARWISRDPSGETGGLNLFAFANNNPIGFFDPNGLAPHLTGITVGPDGNQAHYDQVLPYPEAQFMAIQNAISSQAVQVLQAYPFRTPGRFDGMAALTDYGRLKAKPPFYLASNTSAVELSDPFWEYRWPVESGQINLATDDLFFLSSILPRAIGLRTFCPKKTVSPEVFKKSLRTKPTPTGSPKDVFEIANTGTKNYLLESKGVEFWADGIVNTTIQESKFIVTPGRSPFIQGSAVPDAVRQIIVNQVDDEFARMAKIIADRSNPLREVEVIVSDPAANRFFIDMLKKHGLNGRVINR